MPAVTHRKRYWFGDNYSHMRSIAPVPFEQFPRLRGVGARVADGYE